MFECSNVLDWVVQCTWQRDSVTRDNVNILIINLSPAWFLCAASQPAVENLQRVLIACINHRNCRGKAPLISVQDSWWRILSCNYIGRRHYNTTVSQSVLWSAGHCINIQLCPARNKSTGGKQGGSCWSPLLTTNIAGKSPDQPGQKDKDPDVWFQLMTLCFPDFPDLIISHWFQNITWAEGSSIIEREILQSVRAWILYK